MYTLYASDVHLHARDQNCAVWLVRCVFWYQYVASTASNFISKKLNYKCKFVVRDSWACDTALNHDCRQ